MKRLFIVVLILALCVVTIIGCAKPAPAHVPASTPKPAPASTPTPQYGGVLKIMTTGSGLLGSPRDTTGRNWIINAPAVEFLLRYDVKGSPLPRLAESWDISSDGKNITLNLHQGVKFHDGTDFNAEAVKYNMQDYLLSPFAPSSLKQVSSIDIIDQYTVRLGLPKFNYDLMIALAHMSGEMCSPTAMKIPATPETMAKVHNVFTGPFKLANWQKDVSAVFTKFDSYWQKGKPYLDGIEIIIMADPVTALLAFKQGATQILYRIPMSDAFDLEKSGYNINRSDKLKILFLAPDGANADSPWANKNVREALEYAIDRKAMAAGLGFGYVEPAYQFATPQDSPYSPDLKPRYYDPNKAKQLLTEAGYTNGFNTKIYAKTTDDKNIVTAIQTYLKAVNINAEMQLFIPTAFASEIEAKGWKNGLKLMTPSVPSDISNINSALAGRPPNPSVYTPPGWADKLSAAISQPDEAKRLAQTKEINMVIYNEVMVIPIWEEPELSAIDKSVHDLGLGKGGIGWFCNPADAWLSK